MTEVLEHAIKDSLHMLPFLLAAYLFIEYAERSMSGRFEKLINGFFKFGPFGGALLGCVPQCGFSAAAANLYSNRLTTMGTLIAVFLSTSDEAIAVLLMYPDRFFTILKLLGAKVIIATIAGFLVDLVFRFSPEMYKHRIHAKHHHCHSDGGRVKSVLLPAIKHTAFTYFIILVTTFVLGLAIDGLGENSLSYFLSPGAWYQPFLAPLVGFLPNCAASVLLAQLYVKGVLDFGALLAGLCTGAGVGIVVLFKENRPLRENLMIMCIMYAVAVVVGFLF